MNEEPINETVIRRRARELAEEALGSELDLLLLFGSRARGDATEDSDWDVLALLHDHADRSRARRILREITGQLAEETGEQVNFVTLRWADASEFAGLLTNVAAEGVPL